MSRACEWGLLLALLAAPACNAADLSQLPSEGWVTWQVPMVSKQGDGPCCYEMHDGDISKKGCSLKRKGGSVSFQSSSSSAAGADALVVYALREQGETTQLHGFAADCPVRLDSAPAVLDGVSQAASLAWIDNELDHNRHKRVRSAAVMVIAQHADEAATERLIQLTEKGQPKQVRHDALFWMGQLRGASGLPTIQRAAESGDDRSFQEHALFVLSQSELPQAAESLVGVANDAGQSAEARGTALFWMAQSEHGDARASIEHVLQSEASPALLDKAVFALSQLDQGSDEALIGVIKGDYPRQAKKQALFWLGQSGSKEALDFLDQYLTQAR